MTIKSDTIRALMSLVDKHTDDFKEQEYLEICDFLKQTFEQVNRPPTTLQGFVERRIIATGWITNAPPTTESSTVASIAETVDDVMDEVSSPEPPPPGIITVTETSRPMPYELALARLRAHNNARHHPSPNDWIDVITQHAPAGAITPRTGEGIPPRTNRVYLELIRREMCEYCTRTGWNPPYPFDELIRTQMERRIAITRERLERRLHAAIMSASVGV